jgi:hypothetical protein
MCVMLELMLMDTYCKLIHFDPSTDGVSYMVLLRFL